MTTIVNAVVLAWVNLTILHRMFLVLCIRNCWWCQKTSFLIIVLFTVNQTMWVFTLFVTVCRMLLL